MWISGMMLEWRDAPKRKRCFTDERLAFTLEPVDDGMLMCTDAVDAPTQRHHVCHDGSMSTERRAHL